MSQPAITSTASALGSDDATQAPVHLTLIVEEPLSAHGDLECADAEALMAEAVDAANQARHQSDFLTTQLAAAEAEVSHLRTERARLIALVNAIQSKHTLLADDRDSLAEQIDLLTDEITAMDAALVPEGAVIFAALSEEQVRSTYRALSRVTRGPIPPAIHEAVSQERDLVVAAMTAAGQDALHGVIRRAVRRRREQSRRTRRARSSARN